MEFPKRNTQLYYSSAHLRFLANGFACNVFTQTFNSPSIFKADDNYLVCMFVCNVCMQYSYEEKDAKCTIHATIETATAYTCSS